MIRINARVALVSTLGPPACASGQCSRLSSGIVSSRDASPDQQITWHISDQLCLGCRHAVHHERLNHLVLLPAPIRSRFISPSLIPRLHVRHHAGIAWPSHLAHFTASTGSASTCRAPPATQEEAANEAKAEHGKHSSPHCTPGLKSMTCPQVTSIP